MTSLKVKTTQRQLLCFHRAASMETRPLLAGWGYVFIALLSAHKNCSFLTRCTVSDTPLVLAMALSVLCNHQRFCPGK